MILGFIISTLCFFCDIFYWTKWAASILALRLRKKFQRRRFDLYDFDKEDEPEKMGILIPKEEKTLESPFPEEHLQNAADEIFMYGVNSKSEALLVRIARACNEESEAWIYLKLSDGRWYELEQAAGFQRNFGDKCTSFTCGGLQMYYLEAMRRWRIVYCGMLKERKSDNKTERKSVFVKFTFIWSASSDVYDATYDLDDKLTADGMAQAKWNSPLPPVHKALKCLDFYSQSGVITGLVSIQDEPDRELYLFGERIRFIGEYAVGCKFKHLIGVVPESGVVLHLGKASIPSTFHNMYFGFVVHPTGLLSFIEDGYIISNLTGNDSRGENLTAMFKTRKQQYELRGDFVGNEVRFTSEQGWNGHLELIGTEFEIDGLRGSGFMLTGEIFGPPPQTKVKKFSSLSTDSTRPLTVYFTDNASHSTELTGGKGSSLGKLTKLSNQIKSLDFTVPKGIVVTTEAYEEFLTYEIKEKIDNLKDIAYGNKKGNIHEACKIVASAIESTSLLDTIAKEIERKLDKLFDGHINQYKFAVRSSATGEDTDQMSAAGQMDTFLGVRGLKEIFTAVKKCWASQFGYIAIEYKRQNGQILNSPMAVVIQEMVECDAAGVLFTCDPVTNNPSVTVISGNYGLGESVVSGSEEPDTIVLQKLANDEVKVKSVNVGMKQHKIVLTDAVISEENGTVAEDVPDEEKNRCCISEEMAMKLGKLAFKIENYFKSPRDIEWGIKSNSIYILQSRPITTGGAISDYEIKHEFDAPLRCEKEFYTTANVGEVMPGATSPLGLDVISKYFSLVFHKKSQRQKQRNNFMQSKYFPTGLLSFYNHAMMTVADLLTRVDDLDSVNAQSMMIGIFGRILDDPDLSLLLKRKRFEPISTSTYYPKFLKELFFSGLGIEKIKKETFNYRIPAENGKTSVEIFDLLTRSCNHVVDPLKKHIECTEMSSLWNMYMLGILRDAKGSIDNEVYSDFSKLLASSSNVESADIPSALQGLAHSIAKEINGDTFGAMSVEEAQKWLETSTSSVGFKYRQFLKRHGHRCLKEFDMHSIPWKEDPKSLIKILQNMSGSCKDVKLKEEENFSNMPLHLSIPLDIKSKLLLKILLPNCRRCVREREACKSNLIKSLDNTRKGYQHLSKAMVAEGYLPDKNLIYFMIIDEIRELLESRNPRIIARANHRRKLYPILDSYLFDEISKGRPVPINEKENDEEIEYVADLTMKGIPVSQGTVKAYARVAMTLEEASHLKPGEILITYSTDIGWSPYFPILAGVVTELGGLISHGAVVSREYGLPCVVGLHGATRQFRTGDYILLDGNKGVLQRLSPPEN